MGANSGQPASFVAQVAPASGKPLASQVVIRPTGRSNLTDAQGIADVLNGVIGEGGYTSLTGHWTPESEQAFLQSLGPRSEVFLAELAGSIVGFQVIEPFATYTSTMDHVALLGTYVQADSRGRGIGRKLAEATFSYARRHGYEKCVVYVLAGNALGLAYYRSLGFEPTGRLHRQARIAGGYHDEVIMELHFAKDTA